MFSDPFLNVTRGADGQIILLSGWRRRREGVYLFYAKVEVGGMCQTQVHVSAGTLGFTADNCVMRVSSPQDRNAQQ